MPKVNMRVLAPSRRRRRTGDIFTYQMPDGLFRFGRLISPSAPCGFGHGHLVYFFEETAPTKAVPVSLSPHRLLIPPLFLNQKPWTLGYFEVVEHRELGPGDTLEAHCFRDPIVRFGRHQYFDEKGQKVEKPTVPCGDYGLNSFLSVDDLLSDALGIKRASD